MVLAADVYDLVVDLPAYVSLAAILAFILLFSLYASQRRDLQRLSAWMERDPGHPSADVAASETLLDRAEAELEELFSADEAESGPALEHEEAAAGAEAPAPARAAKPATSERIAMEREALKPHPRWRRLIRQASQPRVLGIIGIVAVVLGLAAIFGSERLLSGPESGRGPKTGAVEPQDVTVAVLNGTSVPGLAAKVGDDVTVNGFTLGAVTNSRDQYDQTVVMYRPGQRRVARKVAHDLGVQPVQ